MKQQNHATEEISRYYMRRAVEERACASQLVDPQLQEIHLRRAAEYDRKASSSPLGPCEI
jgi:hypothetical protein